MQFKIKKPMKIKKDNRGGQRKNSGRKPLSKDKKKILVDFWIEGKIIEANGGIEKSKTDCKNYLETKNTPISI